MQTFHSAELLRARVLLVEGLGGSAAVGGGGRWWWREVEGGDKKEGGGVGGREEGVGARFWEVRAWVLLRRVGGC